MKQFRSWWTILPVSAVALVACDGKKAETTVKQTTAEVVEAAKEVVKGETPAAPVKALTPGERAAFLGIVGHLSKDTESVATFLDGNEMVKRMRSLKTWQFARGEMIAAGQQDPEEMMAAGAAEASRFAGKEVFFAMGKGSSIQTANLVNLNNRMTYFQFRSMAQGFASAMAGGDMDLMAEGMADSTWVVDAMKDLTKDIALIESVAIPPLLAGVKADAATIEEVRNQIATMIDPAMGGEGSPAVPVTFTKGGAEFKGYKLSGETLAAQMEANIESLQAMVAPEDLVKIIESVKKKNLVISAGSLGDYLLFYIGGSEEDCPLVDRVEDSLAASDGISFVDSFADKKVVSFLYGASSMTQAGVSQKLKPLADGIRDGISGVEGFGETRDLAALLDTVGEKEAAIYSNFKIEATGGVIVLEDGVKLELFGGLDQGVMDLDATHKIALPAADDDTLLTASWVVDGESRKISGELAEAMVETTYALVAKASSFDVDDDTFASFKMGFGLFEEKFRADLVGMYEASRTAGSGLGNEEALVVDMKGAVPPIPGAVPQELADEGRIPRIAAISQVTDRKKVAEGWVGMNDSLRNMLKTVSEMSGTEIPMQVPTSSEKNDLVTWYFPLAAPGDDVTPNVTISDKWLVASTSKKLAQEVAIGADASKEDRKGAWMEFNFDALRKAGSHWVDLMDKHGDKVIPDADALAQFRAQLPTIRKGIEAASDWDNLNVYTRKEGGTVRTTLHLKTR